MDQPIDRLLSACGDANKAATFLAATEGYLAARLGETPDPVGCVKLVGKGTYNAYMRGYDDGMAAIGEYEKHLQQLKGAVNEI